MKSSLEGPLFVTEGGQPTHVLLSLADFQRLVSGPRTIVDMLSMPADDDIEFEPPVMNLVLDVPEL